MNRFLALSLFFLAPLTAEEHPQDKLAPSIVEFLDNNCYECHNSFDKEGELDLETLKFDPSERSSLTRWSYILDRVQHHEMPPKEELDEKERVKFLRDLERTLHKFSQIHRETKGRVRSRRLNQIEYQNTIHDLLGIDLPLVNLLPKDPSPDGFSTIAEAQQISYHLLEKHLEIVDLSLDEAFRRALTPTATFKRVLDASQIGGDYKKGGRRAGQRQAILHEGHAISISSQNNYHGRIFETTVPESGWYRIQLTAKSFNPPGGRGIWTQVHSGMCNAKAPTMFWVGSFLAEVEPKTISFEAWMEKDHMLEIRPGDNTLKKTSGKSVTEGIAVNKGAIGTALKSLTIERIHKGHSFHKIKSLLFGDLSIEKGKIRSETPVEDLAKLITRFATRAFRRPADSQELSSYHQFARSTLDSSGSLQEALYAGYRAVLSSPRVLFFTEKLGRLDDYSIASRLSYFLWSSPPDQALLTAAKKGKLSDPKVLRQHTERLLKSQRSDTFVRNFCDSWLSLKDIDFTTPDTQLYPEFDIILKNAMLDETRAFIREMIDADLSVTNVIHSDFGMLNERLARHYRIPGITNSRISKIPLASHHHRGGIITQGSILKVTANGTTTSPIIRGVWLLEQILGVHIPPPPDDIPAVEPDIRGAVSIRDQLDKHRSSKSCNACHIKIDPPGFALENFDVIGGWRENYRAIKSERRWTKGQPVDASYEFPDGSTFDNITDFKKLTLSQPHKIARNLLEKILVYSTGATIEFADRREIEGIVNILSQKNHGFRSLIHAAVQSNIFLSK